MKSFIKIENQIIDQEIKCLLKKITNKLKKMIKLITIDYKK